MRDILNRLFPGPKVPEEYSVKNINERISVGEGAPPIVAKAGGLMNYTRNGYGTVVMQEGDGRVDTVWSSVEKKRPPGWAALGGVIDKMFSTMAHGVNQGNCSKTATLSVPIHVVRNIKGLERSFSDKDGFSKDDVVVYIIFSSPRLKGSSGGGRPGVFLAAMIVSDSDAKYFENKIQEDPDVIFSVLQKINGGPIRGGGFNKSAPSDVAGSDLTMEIDLGESRSITILPNRNFGGERGEKTETKKFSDGLVPNPPDQRIEPL